MTISTTATRITYDGDGVTVAFAAPFPFFAASELEVIARDTAAGTETTKTLGADYTVAGGDGVQGTVTALAAPPAAVQWVIRRKTARTQATDYTPNDPFPAETHEKALDRLTMIAQELGEESDRALAFPKTDGADLSALLPPSLARAGKVAAYDDRGQPTVSNLTLAGIEQGATDASTSATAAAASAAAAAASEIVAAMSETNAAASATSALASKNAAAAIIASGMFSAVLDNSADYTVVEANAGNLIRMATGAADKTITLPLIADLTTPEGFKSAAVKWSGTGNVVIAASGSETINGAASYTIANQYETAVFVADAETNTWTAIDQSPPPVVNPPVLAAEQASSSGTSVDFTGIPSWVKRITVMLASVSASGTGDLELQLGSSGGLVTTGYVGSVSAIDTAIASANHSSGFLLTQANASAANWRGAVVLILENASANRWIASGGLGRTDAAAVTIVQGSIGLSGTLDHLRLTTSNGTDTFDLGVVNIFYE